MTADRAPSARATTWRFSRRWWWALGPLLIGIPPLYLAVLRNVPLERWLGALFAGLEGLGPWAPLAFVAGYVGVCLFLLPDLLPNAAAGALWGVLAGAAAVSAARMVGATAAFWGARRLAGRRWRRKWREDPRMAGVHEALQRDGFKITLLLRLCPIVPVNLVHYGLGLTSVPFRTFFAASLLGLLPRSFVIAYLGAGGRGIAGVLTGQAEVNLVHLGLFWGGFCFLCLGAILLTRRARRGLREAIAAERAEAQYADEFDEETLAEEAAQTG